MTQKEKLYNQYTTLLNTAVEIFPTERIKKHQANLARCRYGDFTVVALKDLIETAEQLIEEAKFEKAKAEYFATEEGANFKREIEENIDYLNEERDKIFAKFDKKIQDYVQQSFGNRFIAKSIGSTSFRVNMIDDEGKEIFGHGWDYYMDSFGHKRLTINYGCLGSFNPFESPERTKFLEALAAASSPLAFGILNEIMQAFNFEINENREEIRSLNKKLNNPKIAA